MSGTSYTADCPECESKDTMICYSDWKPYDTASGTCVHCGFCYFTKEKKLSPKELKELQEEEGYNPETKTFNSKGDKENEVSEMRERNQ